jgi:hypothetical protein
MANSKKPKKARSSKKKLDEMSQTHGKVEKPEEFQPTTLDQIWGADGTDKYGTLSIDDYEGQLQAMSKSELHVHATKIGLIPVDDRGMLTKRLVREFTRHVAQFQTPIEDSVEVDLTDDAKRILKEGS